MDILQKIGQAKKILDEVEKYAENIGAIISENDLAISDIYHYIENNSMSTKGTYRAVKLLREKLITRRRLKEELELLKVFNSHKTKLVSVGNRQMLMAEIGKRQKEFHRPYKYRVFESENQLREMFEH